MSPSFKLLTGIAATWIIALAGFRHVSTDIVFDLGRRAGLVMQAHGVDDGSVRFRVDGRTWRHARLSGTADAATRAAVIAEVSALPGIDGAEWVAR